MFYTPFLISPKKKTSSHSIKLFEKNYEYILCSYPAFILSYQSITDFYFHNAFNFKNMQHWTDYYCNRLTCIMPFFCMKYFSAIFVQLNNAINSIQSEFHNARVLKLLLKISRSIELRLYLVFF